MLLTFVDAQKRDRGVCPGPSECFGCRLWLGGLGLAVDLLYEAVAVLVLLLVVADLL